jgi:hypothetical protein
MKTFKGIKPFAVIKQQCDAAGIQIDDYNYRKRFTDYVRIGVEHPSLTRPDGTSLVIGEWSSGTQWNAFVTLNQASGLFWGITDKGVSFHCSDIKFEQEQWFKDLLSFFYEEG